VGEEKSVASVRPNRLPGDRSSSYVVDSARRFQQSLVWSRPRVKGLPERVAVEEKDVAPDGERRTASGPCELLVRTAGAG
jgi:hypothetical protein